MFVVSQLQGIHIKGGENFCSAHPPVIGELNKKCEFTYFRDGEEKHCHNNVENDSDRFCEECTIRQEIVAEREHDKLEVRQKKNQRRKCSRILTKGKRQGKICNAILPLGYPEDQMFCKTCSKTKEAQKMQENDSSSEQESTDDNTSHDLFQINDHRDPLIELPTLAASTTRSKLLVSRLPIAPHWKFILEMLILKTIQPGPLAIVLHWFANGNFKHNGKSLFEFENNKWTKIASKNEQQESIDFLKSSQHFLLKRSLCL
jgi:hypothetical protein